MTDKWCLCRPQNMITVWPGAGAGAGPGPGLGQGSGPGPGLGPLTGHLHCSVYCINVGANCRNKIQGEVFFEKRGEFFLFLYIFVTVLQGHRYAIVLYRINIAYSHQSPDARFFT